MLVVSSVFYHDCPSKKNLKWIFWMIIQQSLKIVMVLLANSILPWCISSCRNVHHIKQPAHLLELPNAIMHQGSHDSIVSDPFETDFMDNLLGLLPCNNCSLSHLGQAVHHIENVLILYPIFQLQLFPPYTCG